MTQNPEIYEVSSQVTFKGASHISIANIGGADGVWEAGEATPTKTLPADYVWNSPDSGAGLYTITVDGTGTNILVVVMGGKVVS